MNRCALCIPLHPRHFHYALRILTDLQNSDVDLYFIFTTWAEKSAFSSRTTIHFSFFILTDLCPLYVVNKNSSYVTFKKLFALSQLYTKYDYVACCDAEIRFLKRTGFYEMMHKVVSARTICGGMEKNSMSPISRIIRSSKFDLTPESDHRALASLGNIYTWWSNVPVYDCTHVEQFLCWIQFNPQSYRKYSWYVFENMAYDYFCLVRCQYNLVVVPGISQSLESADTRLIEAINGTKCKLYWVNHAAYKQNIKYYLENDFFIVFHLDR